uniref:Uncharacterized protein n=1 Tax=Molossus molossus TaxID=27622 RepID=A0A7J8BBJ3_MOLMO|nr:hypothetical protein HJG59_010466 [Molossus molossus]
MIQPSSIRQTETSPIKGGTALPSCQGSREPMVWEAPERLSPAWPPGLGVKAAGIAQVAWLEMTPLGDIPSPVPGASTQTCRASESGGPSWPLQSQECSSCGASTGNLGSTPCPGHYWLEGPEGR